MAERDFTKKGFKRYWWLLSVALVVVGLGTCDLIQYKWEGFIVLAVGYILWACAINLTLSVSNDVENCDVNEGGK